MPASRKSVLPARASGSRIASYMDRATVSQTNRSAEGDHDRELVGAQANEQVLLAQPGTKTIADDPQDLVAIEVPVGVVYRPELVEVNQDDRSGAPRRRFARGRREGLAVTEPGQRIAQPAQEMRLLGIRERADASGSLHPLAFPDHDHVEIPSAAVQPRFTGLHLSAD